jgi:hypothetical protein
MKRALFAFVLMLAVCAGVGSVGGARAGLDAAATASETYYRADVASGTLSVRVDLHVQNTAFGDLPAVPLYTMPGARNLVAKKDDAVLETKSPTAGAAKGLPFGLSVVTLPKPLKSGAKTDLTVSYDVAPQSAGSVTVSPGMVEALFVSQGGGSFVFVDVPNQADNYFEPGCVKVADQPADVQQSGFERWVCGDVTSVTFAKTDSVLSRCANLDDACRQHSLGAGAGPVPFAGYAQSITDPSLRGTAEADVAMARGPVKITFKYLNRDKAWAEREFAIAQQAFPKLEALFGFQYPKDSLLIRESHFITLLGVAGIAYFELGDVLLSRNDGIDDEVTVHELAHQWASSNLAAIWQYEGLAEYAMRTVAPSLGIVPRDWKWQSYKYTDNLNTWNTSSTVENSNYWYGKAGAFWLAYEKAIGGQENMTKVLAQVGRPDKPVDGRRFMDMGEDVSGSNLDALFLQWVFPDTAKQLLADRRAARDVASPLMVRTKGMGIIGAQKEIADSLAAWQFAGIPDLVAQAGSILDTYTKLYIDQEAVGLGATDRFARAWSTESLKNLAAIVADQRQAMDAITRATKDLAAQPPDSSGQKQLAKARDTYATGNFLEAKRLASTATTAQSNSDSAAKAIELAKAKQTSFSPSFISRIGLLGLDPDGDLAKAQEAAARGDGLTALKLSRSAYDAWDRATADGFKRLAAAAAFLSASVALGWWARRKHADRSGRRYRPELGHTLSQEDRRGTWHDWENS